MVIYIAGPISGIENKNKKQFDEAEVFLKREFPAAEIINPWYNYGEADLAHQQYMKRSAAQLLVSTHVYVLEDWNMSAGAKWEVDTARIFGLPLSFRKTKEEYFRHEVLRVVSEVCGVPREDIMSSSKTASTTEARHIYAYWLYEREGVTYNGIKKYTTYTAHTTVMHAVRIVTDFLKKQSMPLQDKLTQIGRELDVIRPEYEQVKWKK